MEKHVHVIWKLYLTLAGSGFDPCGASCKIHETQTFVDEERALQVFDEIKRTSHLAGLYVYFANLESIITTQVDEFRN